jgi:hypothetical protein
MSYRDNYYDDYDDRAYWNWRESQDQLERWEDDYEERLDPELEDNAWADWYESQVKWPRDPSGSASPSTPPAAPPEPKHPFHAEIAFMNSMISCAAATHDVSGRVEIVKKMFEVAVNYRAFFAAYPRFRQATVTKIAELREDPNGAPLTEILDKMSEMIESLKGREDYKE